eukprot:Gb_07390 [translate_table: standard]
MVPSLTFGVPTLEMGEGFHSSSWRKMGEPPMIRGPLVNLLVWGLKTMLMMLTARCCHPTSVICLYTQVLGFCFQDLSVFVYDFNVIEPRDGIATTGSCLWALIL